MAAPGGTGRALVPFVPKDRAAQPWLRALALVAVFGGMAGIGAAGTYTMRHALLRWGKDPATATALQATKAELARLSDGLDRLRAAEAPKADDGSRALKRAVESLRTDLEQFRASTATTAIQTAARLDRIEREPAAKIVELSARLDRIDHDGKADKAAPDTGKDRTAELTARLDRLEKQLAAPATTGSIPAKPVAAVPPPKSTAGAVALAKPASPAPSGKPAVTLAAAVVGKAPAAVAAKADTTVAAPSAAERAAAALPPVRGWVLRDVYDGVALVQAPGGRMREVEPGEYLPGAGEVRSIQRRGRGWVVLTSRGVIDATF